MTPTDTPDDPTTEAEFDAALDDLVAAAREEGVPIEGTRNVRSPDPETADYTVEISEIVPRAPGHP